MTQGLGMIYARSTRHPKGLGLPVKAARAIATTALLAYPAGALLRTLGPDTLATSLAGFGLILVALVATAMLLGSSVQRIAAEDKALLDEVELALRHRATNAAFGLFAGLTLAAILYAGIASDAGLWLPTAYDQFNGLFWGAFLYATVLPSACVAWMIPAETARG